MTCFTDLPFELRSLIYTYIFRLGQIFPHQNDFPVSKNGVRYEAVSYGWLMTVASLSRFDRLECERILWSQNLVMFNGYTIRRFFSTINELKGRGQQAEELANLRKSWIRSAVILFSVADEDYKYAITERNPIDQAACDGMHFERCVDEQGVLLQSCQSNVDTQIEEAIRPWIYHAQRVIERPIYPVLALDDAMSNAEWWMKFLRILERFTRSWVLQARHLAEMRLDDLIIDLINAHLSRYAKGKYLGSWDTLTLTVCTKLVRGFGNAKKVSSRGLIGQDSRLFERCFTIDEEHEKQKYGTSTREVAQQVLADTRGEMLSQLLPAQANDRPLHYRGRRTVVHCHQ